MNFSEIFQFVYTVALALAMAALAMLAISSRLRRQSRLPKGEIVYEDASGLAKEHLYSKRLDLSGKPDYLLKDRDGSLIPVEVKSGYAPRGDQPYDSHLLQLAVYFFLIEDVLRRPTRYGLIRYRNRTLDVANTDELRVRLMDAVAQMRTLLARGEARRSHDQMRRCIRCSMAHACDERLA
ncbi:MAG: CRISPR-associated protein Cas4 [Blastocatellia bacterium]